jgi:D-alanyl-D-alanine dipeptidase
MSFEAMPITLPHENWDWEDIRAQEIIESGDDLISLSYLPEKILVSPQYQLQNLPGAMSEIYARAGLQAKLIEAATSLPYGYKFVVFDAWRAVETQQALFDQVQVLTRRDHPEFTDEEVFAYALKFVALPSTDVLKPSPHNTGGAIDLSIVDETGRLLEMGTGFDDITARAETDYFEIHDDTAFERTARDNRRLLYQIMTNVGFTNYSGEWWHFDYGNQNWAWTSGSDYAIYGATAPTFPWI